MKISKSIWLIMGLLILLVSAGSYFYWENHSVTTTYHTFENTDIPASFDGYKIVQVSDFHNTNFGEDLPESIQEENPDIIVVTGDVIDRNRTDVQFAAEFLEEMSAIAPVYFVSGNHEVASGEYDLLQTELDRLGIENLDDSYTFLEQDGDRIGLIGLADPLLIQKDDLDEMGTGVEVIGTTLEELTAEAAADFSILLSHRPERFDIYTQTDIDLAFTGHAHGGQIRLPFIGGLYAPTQGFFPDYTDGIYEENGTSMIVSRGLGNSIFPFRVFNRPELVVVTLESQ